jgi:hypothetical protein
MDDGITSNRSFGEFSTAASRTEHNVLQAELSALDRHLLARKISLIDGTAFAEARQQVERFLGSCF